MTIYRMLTIACSFFTHLKACEINFKIRDSWTTRATLQTLIYFVFLQSWTKYFETFSRFDTVFFHHR